MLLKLLHVLLLLFVLEGLFILSSTLASSNFTDQSALLAFKSEIEFDPTNYILSSNWSKDTNFCSWIGVTCSPRRQRVTALSLSNVGFKGTLSPHVGNLSFLMSLILANNSFHGRLPSELGRLRRLKTLVLQINQFEGVIPPNLQHCQELETLSLAYNMLSGGIPEELGNLSKLRRLYLSRNSLTGYIPASLGNISTLEDLVLQQNSLTGSFPMAIFNISSIQRIDLENNSVSGVLPNDICLNSPNLQAIFLRNNRFVGQIPSTIYRCRELRSLSLTSNGFNGSVPRELGSLQMLEILYLSKNNLSGTIPTSLGNLSSLREISLWDNNMYGGIPSELGDLPNLEVLNLQRNHLSGEIPKSIFNISSLRVLALINNSLSGNFPPQSQFRLPNLEQVFLSGNQLSGEIPPYISNCSKLFLLDLSYNHFFGPIPLSLGDLPNLQFLTLVNNYRLAGEPGSNELTFLTALTKCRLLEVLSVDNNLLDGVLPHSIGNFSTSLRMFVAPGNRIKGSIPESIGSLENLNLLALGDNKLNGTIPSTIGGLRSLQRLFLYNNEIEGPIPDEICLLRNLGEVSLFNNKLSASIPNCIGSLGRLQELYLSSNDLSSSIPMSLWSLQNLIFLNLSFNALSGSLPLEMKMLNVIEEMDLSRNQLNGTIPTTIGSLTSLDFIDFSRNKFEGPLPTTIADMRVLEFLDLSYNNLSGPIPQSLQQLGNLKFLNLSFNKLSGEIPKGGPFANFSAQSFLSNEALCGVPLQPCPTRKRSTAKQILLKYVLPIVASVLVLSVLLFILIRRYRKPTPQTSNSIDSLPKLEKHQMVTYEELRQATNNFAESNLLGVGSFGSVYKGVLVDGTVIATKVLNSQLEAAFRSFDVECSVLRTVRHRNLVKIITSCSNLDFRALIMDYMSNGSLEKWLYSDDRYLSLKQRTSILVDVAMALEYLHHGQSEPIVHCDLKPSNVLLDEDMVAHVGDFGIAKILSRHKDATQTKTLGTIGYIAPEFGSEGRVSTRADTYSYGILVLETMTGRKPTDQMFVGELNLRQWVSGSLPHSLEEVVDGALFHDDEEEARGFGAIHDCVLSMLELGLECSKDSPEDRGEIKDIVGKLNKIKIQLLSQIGM